MFLLTVKQVKFAINEMSVWTFVLNQTKSGIMLNENAFVKLATIETIIKIVLLINVLPELREIDTVLVLIFAKGLTKFGIVGKIVVYVSKIMFEMLFKSALSPAPEVKEPIHKINASIFVQLLLNNGKAL